MAEAYPATWQKCATCELWAGSRKLTVFRDQAEVEDPSATGECIGGPFDRMPMNAFGYCQGWKKWGVLQ